jgi:hypothetical protein
MLLNSFDYAPIPREAAASLQQPGQRRTILDIEMIAVLVPQVSALAKPSWSRRFGLGAR